MARTVLITGATGFLGRQVVIAFEQAGWTVVGAGFSRAIPPKIRRLDLCNRAEVETALDEIKPEVVVHNAANSSPDRCDADPTAARAINVEASRALAIATAARSIVLIYVSTDYVFPGLPGEAPYETDAATKPPNLYGQTKLDGEQAVLQASKRAVSLRIPVLYGPAEKPSESAINILMDTVTRKGNGDAKTVVDDWAVRFPTNTQDVARVLVDIAEKYAEEGSDISSLPSVLHFSGQEAFTKYGMCALFGEIMGLPVSALIPNKDPPAPTDVQRPYNCQLSTKALQGLDISITAQNFKDWW
ncbi:MAG: hypothetical protein M1825_005928 [Sarcosagium campestre]|nr:MAG: hypothetical protein M1825_005928 [Sarcosagium campestre]